MIYKSYVIEQNLDALKNLDSFIFYGENYGLIKEFKNKIKSHNKEHEIINFLQEDLLKDGKILQREIFNKSLFEKKKIIFIQNVSDKLFELIKTSLENIKGDKIYLFSDQLDKKSKLRNYFEKSKNCGIAPCYNDNEVTLKRIISTKLKNLKGYNNQVCNLILQTSGLDRGKVNNEIEKIISCFFNKKIEIIDLERVLNIKTVDDFSLLKDEVLKGNKINTNRLLAETIFESEKNIYYLNSIFLRINKLKQIDILKKDEKDLEKVLANLKPPVFWKDKPILVEQSKKWDQNKIKYAIKKLFDIEIKIKSKSYIRGDLLIKNLLIDLCSVANSS